MKRGGDAPEEVEQEVDPSEQISLLGHPVSRSLPSSKRSSILDAFCKENSYKRSSVV